MRALVLGSGPEVFQAIAASLDVPFEKVAPHARLIEELGAGEMELEQLALELESTFEIEVLDDDIPSLRTVQDVLDYVATRFQIAGDGRE